MTALKVTAWAALATVAGLALVAGFMVGAVITARGDGR